MADSTLRAGPRQGHRAMTGDSVRCSSADPIPNSGMSCCNNRQSLRLPCFGCISRALLGLSWLLGRTHRGRADHGQSGQSAATYDRAGRTDQCRSGDCSMVMVPGTEPRNLQTTRGNDKPCASLKTAGTAMPVSGPIKGHSSQEPHRSTVVLVLQDVTAVAVEHVGRYDHL